MLTSLKVVVACSVKCSSFGDSSVRTTIVCDVSLSSFISKQHLSVFEIFKILIMASSSSSSMRSVIGIRREDVHNISRATVASSIAGGITAFVVVPFDVVTRRMQAQRVFTSSTAVLSRLLNEEGVSALFRGLGPTLFMFVTTNALYFPLYEFMRTTMDRHDHSTLTPLVAGMASRTVVVTVSSPIEFLRTQMQTVSAAVGGSAGSAARNIWSAGGLKNLWTGLIPTLWRDVPFSALYWFLVERFRLTLGGHDRTKHTFGLHFFAGSMAGCIAAAVTTPFDVMKTHMQMHTASSDASSGVLQRRKNVADVCKQIYEANPTWRAFFRGFTPRVAKIAPASAVMISTFEYFKGKVAKMM